MASLGRNKYLPVSACRNSAMYTRQTRRVLAHGRQGICTAPAEPKRRCYSIRIHIPRRYIHSSVVRSTSGMPFLPGIISWRTMRYSCPCRRQAVLSFPLLSPGARTQPCVDVLARTRGVSRILSTVHRANARREKTNIRPTGRRHFGGWGDDGVYSKKGKVLLRC